MGLKKELDNALEPAEIRYSGALEMAGVTRIELAASGVTGKKLSNFHKFKDIMP
jgi:hypothetical protein